MAASIFTKTATGTGDLHTGRTRLKAFYVKTASSGSPQVVFKNGSGGATLLDMVLLTLTQTGDRHGYNNFFWSYQSR